MVWHAVRMQTSPQSCPAFPQPPPRKGWGLHLAGLPAWRMVLRHTLMELAGLHEQRVAPARPRSAAAMSAWRCGWMGFGLGFGVLQLGAAAFMRMADPWQGSCFQTRRPWATCMCMSMVHRALASDHTCPYQPHRNECVLCHALVNIQLLVRSLCYDVGAAGN